MKTKKNKEHNYVHKFKKGKITDKKVNFTITKLNNNHQCFNMNQ